MSLIDDVIIKVLEDANKKRESAAYGGEWGDGGARDLETQVRFYRLGQRGEMPVEWTKYERELDPEYQQYLKLKEKFGP